MKRKTCKLCWGLFSLLLVLFVWMSYSYAIDISNKEKMSLYLPNPNFIMSDNLSCEVKWASSDQFKKLQPGFKFSLSELTTDTPSIVIDGKSTFLLKLFEDKETLIISPIIIEDAGVLDHIMIRKQDGKFTRLLSFNLLADVYGQVLKGTCF